MPEQISELGGKFIALDFEVHKSLRYHAKRRAFFEALNHLTRALSAIFGAATIAALVGENTGLAKVTGALIALTAGLDLVLDFSRRARTYDELYRRFADLAVKLSSLERHDETAYRHLDTERLLIEKDEPTSIGVLNVICANEEYHARGYARKFQTRIYFWQRWARQLFSLPPTFKPKD